MENVINLRGALMVLPIVAFVLLVGWVVQKSNKKKRQKPGQYLQYIVPGRTAAECRGLLGKPGADDMFDYTLEAAQSGGWYIHFTRHRVTQQPLDTVFLLQFEGDVPAALSASFVREAFGMKEPVIGEALLDDFFAQRLGAQRVPPEQDGADTP